MDDLLERGYGETRVRVRYAETDQMGVVYHANYLVWFEVGRVELIRQMGMSYKDLERDERCGLAVVEVTARYKSPARYDDELAIRTSLKSVRGPLVKFSYQVVRLADETLLCEGESTHVVVGKDMKLCAMPEKLAQLFASILD